MKYDGYHKYDRAVAESYDQTRQVEAHWWHEDRFVEEFFSKNQFGRLLDLPVGTGRFFQHYKAIRSLTGVDVSENMLEQARKNLTTLAPAVHAELEKGDVFNLRFDDAAFDAAIVWRLIHLLPPDLLPKAVKELCRVTSQKILVQTYAAIPRNPWRARLGWIRSLIQGSNRQDARPWSHIKSFDHTQDFVDGLFAANGFVSSESLVLDKYEGKDVRATVYMRKQCRV